MAETMPIEARLRESIERLYEIFARYEPDATEEDGRYEVDSILKDLKRVPLRLLTAAELSAFSMKALTTCGSVSNFKHFLPRLLEVLVLDPDWLDPCILFSKLEYSGYNGTTELGKAWRPPERQAVMDYAMAVWRDPAMAASDTMRWPALRQCLQAFGTCFNDLSPFLVAWNASSDPSAARQLAEWIQQEFHARFATKRAVIVDFAFWRERPHVAEQVRHWLLDPRRGKWLEPFFYQESDPYWAEQISIAVSNHEWLVANSAGASV
jgi:hypothetical protein